MDILKQLAEEFKIRNTQVENTVKLIDDGNTIPFISRYRKEMTGGLDDQLLRELSERLTYLRNLESRKEEVKSLIESGGNLSDKIVQDLLNAKTLAEVEDIYRPFKPKRKTRAGIAKEKGLQPLADFIIAQTLASPTAEAEKYISEEKGVETVDDAINGALDIISVGRSMQYVGELHFLKAQVLSCVQNSIDKNREWQDECKRECFMAYVVFGVMGKKEEKEEKDGEE